jgi:hypothetical protein
MDHIGPRHVPRERWHTLAIAPGRTRILTVAPPGGAPSSRAGRRIV